MGRPVSTEREQIGIIKCPICGEDVPIFRGYRGTAYCNHAGHGFKLSKRQIDEFLKKNTATTESDKETKVDCSENKKQEQEEKEISLFGMRF